MPGAADRLRRLARRLWWTTKCSRAGYPERSDAGSRIACGDWRGGPGGAHQTPARPATAERSAFRCK